jgi:glycosyltransferase involved in cell wall biosynthesis
LTARINASILALHVKRTMVALGVEAPILWLYEPRHLHLIGRFQEKLVCYFNYDEMPDFPGNERVRELLRAYDDQLSSRADVIFATSRGQYGRRQKLNPSTYFTPNGVDFDLFHSALAPETPVAPELIGLKKPILGFAGWLGNHIDVELLLRVAQAFPDCSMVLVGPDCLPDRARRDQLAAMPNVHFLGQKEMRSLPQYLKAFDVALMPWAVKGHILTAYPLKLHEYLAAGRASVAVALPELRPFSHVVRIAGTHDDYIRLIDEALRDNSAASVEARVAVARENTWDQRVETIYEALGKHLQIKQGSIQYEDHVHRLGRLRPSERSPR